MRAREIHYVAITFPTQYPPVVYRPAIVRIAWAGPNLRQIYVYTWNVHHQVYKLRYTIGASNSSNPLRVQWNYWRNWYDSTHPVAS